MEYIRDDTGHSSPNRRLSHHLNQSQHSGHVSPQQQYFFHHAQPTPPPPPPHPREHRLDQGTIPNVNIGPSLDDPPSNNSHQPYEPYTGPAASWLIPSAAPQGPVLQPWVYGINPQQHRHEVPGLQTQVMPSIDNLYNNGIQQQQQHHHHHYQQQQQHQNQQRQYQHQQQNQQQQQQPQPQHQQQHQHQQHQQHQHQQHQQQQHHHHQRQLQIASPHMPPVHDPAASGMGYSNPPTPNALYPPFNPAPSGMPTYLTRIGTHLTHNTMPGPSYNGGMGLSGPRQSLGFYNSLDVSSPPLAPTTQPLPPSTSPNARGDVPAIQEGLSPPAGTTGIGPESTTFQPTETPDMRPPQGPSSNRPGPTPRFPSVSLASSSMLQYRHGRSHSSRARAAGHIARTLSRSGDDDESDNDVFVDHRDLVRANQALRGSMTTKMVASAMAIKGLKSVPISELDEDAMDCVICYNRFGTDTPEGVNESPLKIPSCGHIFGDHCIKKWFQDSDNCPYCRAKVPSQPRTVASAKTIVEYMRSRMTDHHIRTLPTELLISLSASMPDFEESWDLHIDGDADSPGRSRPSRARRQAARQASLGQNRTDSTPSSALAPSMNSPRREERRESQGQTPGQAQEQVQTRIHNPTGLDWMRAVGQQQTRGLNSQGPLAFDGRAQHHAATAGYIDGRSALGVAEPSPPWVASDRHLSIGNRRMVTQPPTPTTPTFEAMASRSSPRHPSHSTDDDSSVYSVSAMYSASHTGHASQGSAPEPISIMYSNGDQNSPWARRVSGMESGGGISGPIT